MADWSQDVLSLASAFLAAAGVMNFEAWPADDNSIAIVWTVNVVLAYFVGSSWRALH